MKKIFFYIFLLSLTYACKDINDLNGSWVIIDSQNEFQEKTTFYKVGIPNRNNIISFDNGSFKFFQSSYGVNPEIYTGSVELKNNSIFLDIGESRVEINLKTDDLIEIRSNNSHFDMVVDTYKRIDDSLKFKPVNFSLLNKKYIRTYTSYQDTVHFINDSVYRSSSWANSGDNTFNYNHLKQNGFDIILTDQYPPFILKNKIDNIIYLSTFSKEKEDYVMTKVLDDN